MVDVRGTWEFARGMLVAASFMAAGGRPDLASKMITHATELYQRLARLPTKMAHRPRSENCA
jgi:hypothetical protein